MVIWLTTLEAFPKDKQFASPIVANNIRTHPENSLPNINYLNRRSSVGQPVEMGPDLRESEAGGRRSRAAANLWSAVGIHRNRSGLSKGL